MRAIKNNPALIKNVVASFVAIGVMGGYLDGAETNIDTLVVTLTAIIMLILNLSARDSSYGPETVDEIRKGERV